MLFPQLWVNDVEGPFPAIEAILDEGPKHAVLLVHAVEERADVTVRAQPPARELQGLVVRFHGDHLDPATLLPPTLRTSSARERIAPPAAARIAASRYPWMARGSIVAREHSRPSRRGQPSPATARRCRSGRRRASPVVLARRRRRARSSPRREPTSAGARVPWSPDPGRAARARRQRR